MNKVKLLSVILIMALLTGCSEGINSKAGTGIAGEVEPCQYWDKYDEIIEQTRVSQDNEKRAELFLEAESLLMDTGALIPLTVPSNNYFFRNNISGVYSTSTHSLKCGYITKEGSDTVNICTCPDYGNFDYTRTFTTAVDSFASLVSCGLMDVNEQGKVVNNLAETVEVSEDGLTYRFTLRDNLKWSDGSTLNADDFVFSWKRAANPDTGLTLNYLLETIDGYPNNLNVQSLEDGKVFEVKLKNPCSYFLNIICAVTFWPVNQEYIESYPDYMDEAGNIINPSIWGTTAGYPCCGPFTFDTWTYGQSVTLSKNPYYWDAENIKTEHVNMMLSSKISTIFAAYKAGDIDLSSSVSTSIIENLPEDTVYVSAPVVSSQYILFNTLSEVFEGYTFEEASAIRKAIGLSIDRTFLQEVLNKNSADIGTKLLPRYIKVGDKTLEELVPDYEYPYEDGYYPKTADYDKARELLKQVGFEFGENGKLRTPLSFELYMSNGNDNMMALIQQDLSEIGIDIYFRTADSTIFFTDLRKKDFTMAISGWNTDFDDPLGMMEMLHSDNYNNRWNLKSLK